ncbi:MAG: metallophosphoesterase [Halovenus sp.]
MLVALSDTHGETGPRLTAHLETVLRRASAVVHAGDFTTPAVLDAFASRAAVFAAVHGNRDTQAVTGRLPETATLTWAGRRVAVVHGHRHDRTSLSLLARQEGADVVVTGHTHRQAVERAGEITVVNPGSHAEPRASRPGYATFERTGEGGRCVLRGVQGDRVRAVDL